MKGRAFALGLGGNLGPVTEALEGAVGALTADSRVSSLRVSSLYETPPWGQVGGGSFLNCALCGLWAGSDKGFLSCAGNLKPMPVPCEEAGA